LNWLTADGGAAEDRHLEFKEAVPVSDEEQKRQRKAGATRPFDEAVAKGTGIGDFGRNALLEELVAFANVDGGVIVLGMEETADKPARAARLSPVPHVAALERRLRDALNDVIEPRLPFSAVKAIETGVDGSGVVLLETEPSLLAPHWVRPTRSVKVRREDRADPLSMPEIHDMVLRNARRLDAISQQLETAQLTFERHFLEVLRSFYPPMNSSSDYEDQIELLKFRGAEAHHKFVGMRVTIVPHQSLGIGRLEDISELEPHGDIHFSAGGSVRKHPLQNPVSMQQRRVLGGVEIQSVSGPVRQSLIHTLRREGFVELKLVRTDHESIGIHVARLLACVGSALGFYDKLRVRAGASNMPAEVGVEVLTLLDPKPMFGLSVNGSYGDPLEFRTLFPSATVADRSDFDLFLNEVAGDFWNAGNMRTSQLPQFYLHFR
jgi:hypothetical protein